MPDLISFDYQFSTTLWLLLPLKYDTTSFNIGLIGYRMCLKDSLYPNSSECFPRQICCRLRFLCRMGLNFSRMTIRKIIRAYYFISTRFSFFLLLQILQFPIKKMSFACCCVWYYCRKGRNDIRHYHANKWTQKVLNATISATTPTF